MFLVDGVEPDPAPGHGLPLLPLQVQLVVGLVQLQLQVVVQRVHLVHLALGPEWETLNNFCPSKFSQVCSDFHFLQIANLDAQRCPGVYRFATEKVFRSRFSLKTPI